MVYVNGVNLRFYGRNSSSQVEFDVTANNIITDSTAWYHVMMVGDFTNSTANDTTRFYVNGVRVSQSQITTTNVASGNGANGTGLQLIILVDIMVLNIVMVILQIITLFGMSQKLIHLSLFKLIEECFSKAYTGSYGTYGFHLDFADSALTASGIGDDNAGIGDFTPTNFPDANGEYATGSVVTDTPTSNHSTLMDQSFNSPLITKGMLRSVKSADRYFATGNTGIRDGKWYWEYLSNDFGA